MSWCAAANAFQALKPAEIAEVQLDAGQKRATVYVHKDHLSQAIGKGGRNVRLASRLAAWEIDIYELGGDGPEAPAPDPEEVPPEEAPAEGVSESGAAPAAEGTPSEEKKNEG